MDKKKYALNNDEKVHMLEAYRGVTIIALETAEKQLSVSTHAEDRSYYNGKIHAFREVLKDLINVLGE